MQLFRKDVQHIIDRQTNSKNYLIIPVRHYTRALQSEISRTCGYIQQDLRDGFNYYVMLYALGLNKPMIVYDYTESLRVNKNKIVEYCIDLMTREQFAYSDRFAARAEFDNLITYESITDLSLEQFEDILIRTKQLITQINCEINIQKQIKLVEKL